MKIHWNGARDMIWHKDWSRKECKCDDELKDCLRRNPFPFNFRCNYHKCGWFKEICPHPHKYKPFPADWGQWVNGNEDNHV